jgi:hypothetical protein
VSPRDGHVAPGSRRSTAQPAVSGSAQELASVTPGLPFSGIVAADLAHQVKDEALESSSDYDERALVFLRVHVITGHG